jgi:glycosyltransferase involved in cell wall biosynthesis
MPDFDRGSDESVALSRTDAPRVAVTIPTKNSAATLLQCLESVHYQKVPIELIVADDNSVDGTQGIAIANGAVLLEGPLPLLEARYQAARISTARLVLFLDSDQILEAGTLARAISLMERFDALVLEERSEAARNWIERLFEADRRASHRDISYNLNPVGGSLLPRMFRRTLLLEAFDTIPRRVRQVAVAQDHAIIYLAFSRLGGSVALLPQAVRHREMASLGEVWRKYYKWGRGLVDLFSVAPEYKNLTDRAVVHRLRRGSTPLPDYLRSISLLALKTFPYATGYLAGRLNQMLRGTGTPR